MKTICQHYSCYKQFNRKIYRNTLNAEHILKNGNKIFVDTIFKIRKDGSKYKVEENVEVNTKCILLEKRGVRYILPTQYIKYLPINVKESFDCFIRKSDKTIYKFIVEPTSVRITPEKTMSLKELVKLFNPLEHSNPKTWQFLKLQAVGSKFKGGKYRLCSPPETGKNANDIIIHCITNDNVTVSKPTLAKLETLFYYYQKIICNEITSLTSAQVRDVEPFFLNIADESPVFQKHSMATKKDMNEVDISNASCIFTYNDRASLHIDATFFDDVFANIRAMNSRYPAVYLEGKITTELPKLSMAEAKEIVEENFEEMKTLAKNLVYYFTDMTKELHNYNRDKLMLRGRKKVNFECVIDAIDVYCDNQKEFDEWMLWINSRIADYKKMNKSIDLEKINVKEERVL